jgi:hypothetical protein
MFWNVLRSLISLSSLFHFTLVESAQSHKALIPKSRYVPNFVSAPNSAGNPRSPNVQIEQLTFRDGWKYFDFDGAGHYANTFYQVNVEWSFNLEVVDLYCKGDSFAIYNGTAKLGESPNVLANCVDKTPSPFVARTSREWSRLVVENLSSGSYYFKIRMVESPFGAGTAAIRITEEPY